MKSNLQYIFGKITRRAVTAEEWEKLDRVALIDLAIAIGAADRGVAIAADKAGLIAETVMAARAGDVADVRRLGARLNHDEPKQNLLKLEWAWQAELTEAEATGIGDVIRKKRVPTGKEGTPKSL